MATEETSASYEIAHVLFVDIVAYSVQTIDRQTDSLNLLQRVVRETNEFQRNRGKEELISLPTGDGMALVFLRDPLSPVRCALEIAAALKTQPTEMSVRMGIHSGPVQRHADIREGVNVVGGGINIAQRVMDCGDAGHILLSRNVAEVLEQFSDWRESLRDLGVYEVKHGVKLELYNLTKGGLGNPAVPSKLASHSRGAVPDCDATTRQKALREELIRRGGLFLAVFASALVVTMLFEAWLDRGISSGAAQGITADITFAFSGLYQRLVAAPRNPIPRYTMVVEIDAEHDPGSVGLHDLCGQRKMMAALIRRVAAGMPKVIAIDKFFGTRVCEGNINADLLAAMKEVSAKVPLVIGRRIDGEYLDPTLVNPKPGLHEAIVNIDPDSRKVPLAWQVYPSREDMEKSTHLGWHNTLALEAVRASEGDSFQERHPRLAQLMGPPPRHPYISFLDLKQFHKYRLPAGFILCGRAVKPGEDATACPPATQHLSALSGKIVLIGEISRDEDVHASVVGQIPGAFLQANFIEALLDDRYYEGFPALSYVFGFIFLADLELMLAIFRKSWILKMAAIAGLVVATLLLLYVVITDLHRYVNPLPFIALALLIRALIAQLPYFKESRATSAGR